MAGKNVFSVKGGFHTSSGNPDLLVYERPPLVNDGNCWNGSSAFTVPLEGAGIYYFSLSFIKAAEATDVAQRFWVSIELRRTSIDGKQDIIGKALAERSSRTGVLTLAIQLQDGDMLETYANSEEGEIGKEGIAREIQEYRWTGFLVTKIP